MPRFLLALFVCCLAFPSVAQKSMKGIQKNVKQAVNKTLYEDRSKNAHDKAVFIGNLYVHIEGILDKKKIGTDHTFRCPAVRIDKNWLMMSSTCIFSGKELAISKDRGLWFKEAQSKVTNRAIKKITVEDIQVKQNSYVSDKQSNLIFIHIDTNSNLMKKLDKKGGIVANLLIAQNPDALTNTIDKAYINRPRGGFIGGHTSDRVGIEKYCTEKKCYMIEWELYNGTTGDPLFLLSKKHGKAEFLAGLNNAPAIRGDGWEWDINYSSGYQVFDANTMSALERVIKPKDAAAFQRIKEHIVNELNF